MASSGNPGVLTRLRSRTISEWTIIDYPKTMDDLQRWMDPDPANPKACGERRGEQSGKWRKSLGRLVCPPLTGVPFAILADFSAIV